MKILHVLIINMILCTPLVAGEIPTVFNGGSQIAMPGNKSFFKHDKPAHAGNVKCFPATAGLTQKDQKKGFDLLSWDGRVRFRLGKNITLALTYN